MYLVLSVQDIGLCYPFLLYFLCAMARPAPSALFVQHLSNAGFLFDREAPFSPLHHKEDVPPPSPAQSQFSSSPGGLSSPTSSLRSQHRYSLTNGKGGKGNEQPWLTLLVSSRSPKPNFLPLFIGNDSISGTVELDLAKSETVREIKVTVCVVFLFCIAVDLPLNSLRARQLTSLKNHTLFLKHHRFCLSSRRGSSRENILIHSVSFFRMT